MREFLYGILLISCISLGCESEDKSQNKPEVWEEQTVKKKLTYRWNMGDSLPGFHNDLLAFFPKPWKPFVRREVKSSGIYERGAFMSEATGVYFQSDNGFIEVYLADYSADSSAFLYLIQSFAKVQEEPGKFQQIFPEEERDVFAWKWVDKQNGLAYLEAGAYTRYHIYLRTNLPESDLNLKQAWQKLQWSDLRRLAPSV